MKPHKFLVKLKPVPKEIIWGGDKLKYLYNKSAPFGKIAESWELTVRDDGMSVISGGIYDRMPLVELLAGDLVGTVGTAADNTRFPLLIKFIDAESDLSVQVHPNDEYAIKNEGEPGKTEMWYIIRADEGAELVYGLNSDVSHAEFEEAIRSGNTGKLLHRIKIHEGDAFFIPPGQVHAICSGALLAEIQQNSNVTYRIYDYDRIDKNGKKRELHVDKALDSVHIYTDDEINALRFEGAAGRKAPHPCGNVLCDCKYFRVSAFDLEENLTLTAEKRSFLSLLFIDPDGYAVISSCGVTVTARGGDSVFVPAGSGEVSISGRSKFLLSEL